MNILEISDNQFAIIPIALILIIFLLGLKKNKKIKNRIDYSKANENIDISLLKKYEQKLLALKDLYKQDLINAELYENKIDLITKRVEEILGDEFDSLPNFQQKVIMDTLKEDIKTKIKIIPSVKRENNIDNLIQAVDSRINKEKIYEEKNSEIIDEVKKSVDASKPMKRKINNKLSEEKIKEEKLIKSIVDDWIAENAKTISKEILQKKIKSLFK